MAGTARTTFRWAREPCGCPEAMAFKPPAIDSRLEHERPSWEGSAAARVLVRHQAKSKGRDARKLFENSPFRCAAWLRTRNGSCFIGQVRDSL